MKRPLLHPIVCCAVSLPLTLLLMAATTGCNETQATSGAAGVSPAGESTDGPQATPPDSKTAVLLVSHGSHSKQWREMLLDIEDQVRDQILEGGAVTDVQSAFMEYNEPSIATRLKEFDQAGVTEVVIVPLLLTVSSHSFDDIPTIAGQKEDHKSLETLRLEGIEVYRPKAKVTVSPLLDFPDVLGKNVVRRAREMSQDAAQEGVVLVAYGSEDYNEEWEKLLEGVGDKVHKDIGIDSCEYCWCGHIARYKSEPTEQAIRKVLEEKSRAIVIPVLVAVDENFQGKIIGGGVKNADAGDRVLYRHDAILPDENINAWVVQVSQELAGGGS